MKHDEKGGGHGTSDEQWVRVLIEARNHFRSQGKYFTAYLIEIAILAIDEGKE